MAINIILIIFLLSCLGLLHYFFFISDRDGLKLKPPSKRPPVERGYRITTFGTNPNRSSNILNQTPRDERATLNKANEKAFATVSKRASTSSWQRDLALLGIKSQSQKVVLGMALLVSSLLTAVTLTVPILFSAEPLALAALMSGGWLAAWSVGLVLLRIISRFALQRVERSIPFSFALLWAAIRSSGNVVDGIKFTASAADSMHVKLPIIFVLRKVAERCRGDITFEQAMELTPEVRLYPTMKAFCSALHNFQRGIQMQKSLDDIKNFHANKRKVRNKFSERWSLSYHANPLATLCECRGLPVLTPLILLCAFSFTALLLTVAIIKSYYWINALIFVLFFSTSQIARTLTCNDERDLYVIIRPFLSRLKQGTYPEVALGDALTLMSNPGEFRQTSLRLLNNSAGPSGTIAILQESIRSTHSLHVQRFWLAFACAATLKLNLTEVLEELILDLHANHP